MSLFWTSQQISNVPKIKQHLLGMDATQRNATVRSAITISSTVKRKSRKYIPEMHEEMVGWVKQSNGTPKEESKIRSTISF